MMQIFGEIPKARGVVLLTTMSDFAGRTRVDVREWVEQRMGDPDTRTPTKTGINVPVNQLPRLLAALHQAEQEAIRAGHLRAADYEAAGQDTPADLRPRVA